MPIGRVYVDNSGRHGISVPLSLLGLTYTQLYACANCGYLEFYIQSEQDLIKIPKKFQKVKS